MWRHHRCGRNHCCPNGFYEELQVLRCETRSHHSIDVPDVLSVWSSADLHHVAQCRQDNGPISELPTETELMARACHYHRPEICYEFDMQKTEYSTMIPEGG